MNQVKNYHIQFTFIQQKGGNELGWDWLEWVEKVGLNLKLVEMFIYLFNYY